MVVRAAEAGAIYDLGRGTSRRFDFGASIRRQRGTARRDAEREEKAHRERQRVDAASRLTEAQATVERLRGTP